MAESQQVTIMDYTTGEALGEARVDLAHYAQWPEGLIEAGQLLDDAAMERLGISPQQTVWVQE
jgi:hypothetical protein